MIEAFNVTVFPYFLPDDRCGLWLHDQRVILLDRSVMDSPIQYRSTLAHELGHAALGHTACTPRWEAQATEWAARRLINDDEFVEAARLHEGSVAIAHQLDVLPRDVEAYAEWRRKTLLTFSANGHLQTNSNA